MEHGLDIVIPARNEEIALGHTLRALLCEAAHVSDLRVIIVVNGAEQNALRKTAERFICVFEEAGLDLAILATDRAGKAAALNVADDWRDRRRPVIYLDADCILLPGTLRDLTQALSVDLPVVVSAPLRVVPPRSPSGRSYFRIWSVLPNVSHRVIGAGCYALSARGRARFGHFPDEVADDVFVFDIFTRSEIVSAGRGKLFVAPDGSAMIEAVRRWARPGVRSERVHTVGRRQSLAMFRKNPALLRHLPAFVIIKARARLVRAPGWPRWTPRRPDGPPAPNRRPRLRVVIVTYNSAALIAACIESVVSRWADLEIVVVDNASCDLTLAVLDAHDSRSHMQVISNSDNPGFAQAANQGAKVPGRFDHILLLNPDAILEEDAIDTLLALAFAAPAAGLYGGQMTRPDGEIDHSSCLARPSLGSAALFASGLSAMRGRAILDPDSLGGWTRNDIRHVPVLTGGLLLVDGSLWTRLGGFDESFFLYSEDSDLALRASRTGASCLFIPDARYTHHRGASHAEQAGMKIHTLRGKCRYYRKHFSPLRAQLAVSLLYCGVALRAALGSVGSENRAAWTAARHRARDWL